MAEKTSSTKKTSEKTTKQEMLEAYQTRLQQVEEKKASELNPAKRLEQKKADEAVKVAEGLALEGIDRAVATLKSDIGKALAEIGERLATEVANYRSVQKAIQIKQQEIQELYGIETAASSLAALIEAQDAKRLEFEAELGRQKEELKREIEETRAEWEREAKAREAEIKERDAAEKKTREREKEEYLYAFKRDQQTLRDKLNDEKSALEKEILRRKEVADKDLAEREKVVAEKERELAELRARAAAFPKELETSLEKAAKEAADKVRLEFKNREDLLRKEAEGERNVLNARIDAMEKAIKELMAHKTRLEAQLEAAYQKVQIIAEKAIEGSSQAKSLAELQKLLTEQVRKPAQEKS